MSRQHVVSDINVGQYIVDLRLPTITSDIFIDFRFDSHELQSSAGHYIDTQGLYQLRKYIADFHERTSDEVVITNGASEAIYLIMSQLDVTQIWIPRPGFPAYEYIASQLGIEIKTYNPSHTDIPRLLEQHASKADFAILVNSPHNPTGVAWSEDYLNQIIDVAMQAEGWVILDGAYAFFQFNESNQTKSISYDRLLDVYTFSKTLAIPGLRVGYAFITNDLFRERLVTHKMHLSMCTSSVSQHILSNLYKHGVREIIDNLYQRIRANSITLCQALDLAGISYQKPDGGFFLTVTDMRLGNTDSEMVTSLQRLGIGSIPSHVFNSEYPFARLSFAVDSESLAKVSELLEELEMTSS